MTHFSRDAAVRGALRSGRFCLTAAVGFATANRGARSSPTPNSRANSLSLFSSSADSSPRAARTSLISIERLRRASASAGSMDGMRRERRFLVDQQHEELLAHHRLELRQRHVADASAANAAHGLKAALVDRSPAPCRHRAAPRITASRSPPVPDARLELGDRASAAARDAAAFRAPCAAGAYRRDRCRRPPAAPASHRPPGKCVRRPPRSSPARRRAQRRSARDTFSCMATNGLSAATGLRSLRTCSAMRRDRRHHRIRIGEQLVLQPQRMQLLHPLRHRRGVTQRATRAARRCGKARD